MEMVGTRPSAIRNSMHDRKLSQTVDRSVPSPGKGLCQVLLCSLLTLASCASSDAGFLPVGVNSTKAYSAPRVSHRTVVILSPALATMTHLSPRSYQRGGDGNRPYEFKTGDGLSRTVMRWAPAVFVNPRFAKTIGEATTSTPGQGLPELVVVPHLTRLVLIDDDELARAEVSVRVLLVSAVGSAIDNFELTATGVSPSSRGRSDDPDGDRLRGAIANAFDEVLNLAADEIRRHPALRSITVGKVQELVARYAVRYQAALECAAKQGQGASTTSVDARFGLEYPEVRTRMRLFRQRVGEDDQLAIALIGCSDDRRSAEELLVERLTQVRRKTDAGNFEQARETLAPLTTVAPEHPGIRAESQYLDRAIAKREAEEREVREAKEREIREAQEAEAKAIREAEEAAEREVNRTLAQKQIDLAGAHVRARRFADARSAVNRARELLNESRPEHLPSELAELIQEVDGYFEREEEKRRLVEEQRREREARLAEAKRKAEINRVTASVPRMISQCKSARDAHRLAEQAERQAGASGNAQRARAASKARERAYDAWVEAQSTLRHAIALYEREGLGPAANGIRDAARPHCGSL